MCRADQPSSGKAIGRWDVGKGLAGPSGVQTGTERVAAPVARLKPGLRQPMRRRSKSLSVEGCNYKVARAMLAAAHATGAARAASRVP
jgi:hypothetical protein